MIGGQRPAESPGVVLSVAEWFHQVQAGGSTNVKVDVENRGAQTEELRVVIDGPVWVEAQPPRISLEAGAGSQLNVRCRPPGDNYPGTFDVTVRVQGSREATRSWASFRLTVDRDWRRSS